MLYFYRQLPNQSCWILDGFPADIAQAHMLETALGGALQDPEESVTINLVDDPNPPNPPSPPVPVLDLVVLLDIPDERVLQRALNHLGIVHYIGKGCVHYKLHTYIEKGIDKYIHTYSIIIFLLLPQIMKTDGAASNSVSDDRTLYLAQIQHR